jgi:hypothetical protein
MPIRSNEINNVSTTTARARTTNRSNYDNVASMQQQRNVSAQSGRTSRLSPGQGFEEANV